MPHETRDLAQMRLANAIALFEEFARAVTSPSEPATLRGIESRFAAQLLIQPSYWSQIKGRSRQIGERLARQFEQRMGKPAGWLDTAHGVEIAASASDQPLHAPRDDEERFIVDLVLTYYRRHPDRARSRLLDMLGEALRPEPEHAGIKFTPGSPASAKAPAADDAHLWSKTRAAVAPLKRKR